MINIHFNSGESTDPKDAKDKGSSPILSERLTIDLQELSSMIAGINIKNDGSWLYPFVVDNFVEIGQDSEPGSEAPILGKTSGNNRVIEFEVGAIANAIIEGTLEGQGFADPIDFIEIKRMDRGRMSFPDRDMWKKIFRVDDIDDYRVSPNGSLFISPSKNGRLFIQFQNEKSLEEIIGNNSFFALSYSICFHFKLPFATAPVFCRIDPVVQIRSNPE